MFAVVDIAGTQFEVTPGAVLNVPLLKGEPGDKIKFSNLLVYNDGSAAQIGKPYITGYIDAQILEHGKGNKVLVFHKKRRKGNHKLNGHRQKYTKVEIDNVFLDEYTPEPIINEAAPVEIEDIPVEAETSPVEVDTLPVVAETSPIEVEAIRMEVEVISAEIADEVKQQETSIEAEVAPVEAVAEVQSTEAAIEAEVPVEKPAKPKRTRAKKVFGDDNIIKEK